MIYPERSDSVMMVLIEGLNAIDRGGITYIIATTCRCISIIICSGSIHKRHLNVSKAAEK